MTKILLYCIGLMTLATFAEANTSDLPLLGAGTNGGSVSSSSSDPNASLNTGLVFFYNLGQSTGTLATDSGPNNVTLSTSTNAPGQTGGFGTVAQVSTFTATSSMAFSTTTTTNLILGSTDFTAICWILQKSTVTNEGIMGIWDAGGSAGGMNFLIKETGAQLLGYVSNATTNFDAIGVVPATGTWHMVMETYTSSSKTIGISADLGTVATQTLTGSPNISPTGTFKIGASGAVGQFWTGQISTCGAWSRLLTGAEKSAIYNSGNALQTPF